MDRKKIVDLFQKGMQYPPGKHHFWFSRCFEITVRPDSVVELDEYEGFSSKKEPRHPSKDKEMFHVGRSIVNLRDGQVTEQSGKGWEKKPKKP